MEKTELSFEIKDPNMAAIVINDIKILQKTNIKMLRQTLLMIMAYFGLPIHLISIDSIKIVVINGQRIELDAGNEIVNNNEISFAE